MFRYFLLSIYLLIPYFPLFGEIDRIGSQVLIMSILNFISIGYIFNQKLQLNFLGLFNKREILYYGTFIVVAFFSGLQALNKAEFLIEILRTVTYFISLLIFLILVNKEKIKKYLIWLILLTLVFDVFGLLVQKIQGLSMIGFTANKNVAAFSIVIKSCYLVYIINEFKSFFLKSLFFSFYVVFIFVLISINSKGSILALYFGIFYLLVLGILRFKTHRFRFYNTLILLSLFIITILTTNLKSNTLGAFRNTTINFSQDEGNRSRVRYLKQAFESFKENPIFGVGYGNWKIESIKYDALEMRDYVVQYYSHNDYIQILAEIGIFGLLSYLMIFVSLLKKLYQRAINEQNSLIPYLGLGLLIYIFDALINFPAFRVTSQINLVLIITFLNFKNNEK